MFISSIVSFMSQKEDNELVRFWSQNSVAKRRRPQTKMTTVLLLLCHLLPFSHSAPEPDTHLHVYLPPEGEKGSSFFFIFLHVFLQRGNPQHRWRACSQWFAVSSSYNSPMISQKYPIHHWNIFERNFNPRPRMGGEMNSPPMQRSDYSGSVLG